MTIETKYSIGDLVHLFGFNDWPCIITAITRRASGQTEYQLEWNNEGKPESDWFDESRIELLEQLTVKQKEWEETREHKKNR